MRQRRSDRPRRRLADPVLPHAARQHRGAAGPDRDDGRGVGASRSKRAHRISPPAPERAPRWHTRRPVPARHGADLRIHQRNALGRQYRLCPRRFHRRRVFARPARVSGHQGRHRRHIRMSATAPALVIWGYVFGGRKGDTIGFRIDGPDGLVQDQTVDLTRTQVQLFRAVGRKRTTACLARRYLYGHDHPEPQGHRTRPDHGKCNSCAIMPKPHG